MSLNDPIVDEIHEFRAQHAMAFDHNIRTIVSDLIRRQEDAKAHGKEFVRSPGKKCKPGLRYTPEESAISKPLIDAPHLGSGGTPSPQSP
jgi:hypothetical protein